MKAANALVAAAVLTCIFGILVPELIGARQSGYSNAAQYLSELGATDAPYAFWANYAGFLLVGVCVALVCLLMPVVLRPDVAVVVASVALLGVSVGYLGAVVMPCDPGCAPSSNPGQQAMHNLFAMMEYVGAIVALFIFAWVFRSRGMNTLALRTLLAAAFVVCGFVLMIHPDMQQSRGAWQRMADYSIFAWILIVSLVLRSAGLRGARSSSAQ